jgi:hypothetical protein
LHLAKPVASQRATPMWQLSALPSVATPATRIGDRSLT